MNITKLLSSAFFCLALTISSYAQYSAPTTAGLGLPASLNVVVGNNAAVGLTAGFHNSFFGYQTGYGVSTGNNNSFFGFKAGLSDTSGSDNAFFGKYAGYFNITGSRNCFFGYAAGDSNTIGTDNTYLGHSSGFANTKGKNNFFGGSQSGFNNTLGDNNIYIGYNAAYKSTAGNENIYIGKEAGLNAVVTNYNVFVGTLAGAGGAGSNLPSGSDNVGVGYAAGRYIEAGRQNTYLGSHAGEFVTAGNNYNGSIFNSTAVGYNARFSTKNQMSFGNTSVTAWFFGRTDVSNYINSAGTWVFPAFQVGTNTTNGNGAALSQGGTWENASDIHLKTNISELDGRKILDKINSLKITRWMYTGTHDEYHIGPMAQEFYLTFNVGSCNNRISTVDPAGIALVGIQQLSKEVESLKKEIEELKQFIAAKNNSSLLTNSSTIQLFQNAPNPFNEKTNIYYQIPNDAQNALCHIFDINGNFIKSYKITELGNGHITINGNELKAGSYIYSLSINGQIIDSKMMVLVRN